MDKENKNNNLNQLINASDKLDENQLFFNNNEQIFVDSKTGMISVDNINSVYNNNININNNSSVNAINYNNGNNNGNVVPTNQTNNSINYTNNFVNQNNNYIPVNNNQAINNGIKANLSNNNEINDNLNIDVNVKDINVNDKKNNFWNFLSNRKVLLWMSILIFVFTSITVGKTFYLRSVVDNYEEFFTVIEEKESLETVVYDEEELLDDNLKNIAASELINCINSSVDTDKLPNSVTSIIDEMNKYYNRSNDYFAFKYKDIYTGFSVSYNENQKIFTASTIKAPKDIYIYEMASLGKINLDDKLTYTSGYYNTGTGTLKKKNFNTKYDVRTLSKYSIVYSDNAAHNMLMDKYGRQNMLNFWKEKGTNAIFTQNSNWGVINAHDAIIYMEELYRFYVEDDIYGQELMNNFLNANPKFIKGKNGYKIANKSGWSGTAIHDVSIVFADNPYIVVALSNLGKTDYYMSYFNKANDFAYRLHTEYWKYKMETCDDINQY